MIHRLIFHNKKIRLFSSSSSSSGGAWSSRLLSIPAKYPFAFGVGLSCVKTSFSDLLVQKVVERKEQIDWKRNAAFAAFGFFYLGCIQYTLYVPIFGRLFPNAAKFAAKPLREKLKDGKGLFSLISQVFLDQCVHHPFMYFPAFYCTKELVMNGNNPNFTKCLQDYQKTIWEDLRALWAVWVPATVVNFAFMPMYARIPFVAGVSLLWTCILSTMRGGDVAHGQEIAGGAVTGATYKMVVGTNTEGYSCPVDLDKNMSHVIMTVMGPDRVGWVALISRTVASQGGNITHSKMVRLGQDFVLVMHVAVPPEERAGLVSAINSNKELEALNIRTSALSRRETGKFKESVMGFRIHCVGQDKPGMLAAIAEKVCEKGLSIEQVTTELRMDQNNRRLFVITADCTTSFSLSEDHILELVKDFSTLKNNLNLDVFDVRIYS